LCGKGTGISVADHLCDSITTWILFCHAFVTFENTSNDKYVTLSEPYLRIISMVVTRLFMVGIYFSCGIYRYCISLEHVHRHKPLHLLCDIIRVKIFVKRFGWITYYNNIKRAHAAWRPPYRHFILFMGIIIIYYCYVVFSGHILWRCRHMAGTFTNPTFCIYCILMFILLTVYKINIVESRKTIKWRRSCNYHLCDRL